MRWLALVLVVAGLGAADRNTAPRVFAQALLAPSVGRDGLALEPGLAVEWSLPLLDINWLLRPEVFWAGNDRISGGGTLAVDLPVGLPAWQALDLGPRVVNHLSDEGDGIEVSAAALWTLAVPASGHRSLVQVIATAGTLDQGDEWTFVAGGGLAWGWQF